MDLILKLTHENRITVAFWGTVPLSEHILEVVMLHFHLMSPLFLVYIFHIIIQPEFFTPECK
jgi:hypothetical protein